MYQQSVCCLKKLFLLKVCVFCIVWLKCLFFNPFMFFDPSCHLKKIKSDNSSIPCQYLTLHITCHKHLLIHRTSILTSSSSKASYSFVLVSAKLNHWFTCQWNLISCYSLLACSFWTSSLTGKVCSRVVTASSRPFPLSSPLSAPGEHHSFSSSFFFSFFFSSCFFCGF